MFKRVICEKNIARPCSQENNHTVGKKDGLILLFTTVRSIYKLSCVYDIDLISQLPRPSAFDDSSRVSFSSVVVSLSRSNVSQLLSFVFRAQPFQLWLDTEGCGRNNIIILNFFVCKQKRNI